MERTHVRGGSIEVITGSMFSGKTEELIRRLRRGLFAKQNVQAFKPRIDNRYSESDVMSHNQSKIQAEVIDFPEMIYEKLHSNTEVVGVDEAQFFSPTIVQVCMNLADQGLRVIVAGLDTDYRGRPFGSMPELMTVAEFVTKQHAICMSCGSLASKTQRIVANAHDILVGSGEFYEARCRLCFEPPIIQNPLQSTENKVKESTWNV
ncbi:MAG: thymidine kinase [Bdellovibrionales bacterium]|nr:thymidine kinase [Bdellovibrionales bacterium]